MQSARFALSLLFCASITCTAWAAPIPNESSNREIRLHLAAQPIADSLNQLAEAAGLQIVFYSDAAHGVQAPQLVGTFDIRSALDLLLANTPLEYEFVNSNTVVVRVRKPVGESAPSDPAKAAPQSQDATKRIESRDAEHADRAHAETLELDEVRVTARRRRENLQMTPVAVTALSGTALDLRSVRSIDAISQFVPNLQFDSAAPLSGAAYNATIFIRGVGQNDFAIFSDPGVAVYLDGVYLGRSIGGVMDLLDVDQIQVLRGPQGTLFGRNTIGGAVLMSSREPDSSSTQEIELTAGNLSRRDLRATLNLPITDTLSTRISAATMHRDGYEKRLTDGEELGDKNSTTARVQLAYHSSDALNARLIVDTTRVRQASAPLTLVDVATSGMPFLNLYNSLVAPNLGIEAPNGSSTINDSWLTNDIDATYASGRSVNNLDADGATLILDTHAGSNALRSISAWRSLSAQFARDGDNTPFTFRETYNDDHQEQFSQELQWSGSNVEHAIDWVSGIYFFQEQATEKGRAILAPGVYTALEALDLPAGETWCGLAGANPRPISNCPASLSYGGSTFHDNNVLTDLDVDLYTHVRNRSIAVFGQGTHRLTQTWSVTAGLRWTRDVKDIQLEHRRRSSGVYIVGAPGSPQPFSTSSSELTPKLGLEWQATPDAMIYLSYARGFKSGGFNGRPLVNADEVSQYDPEIVDSYEVGAKTRWLDGRMIANAAVFFNDYRDMQLSINATPQNFVRNAGAARITGAELEIAARFTRGLNLNLALGYLNGSYTSLDSQLATLRPALTVDKQLVKAPEWTVSTGLQYQFNVNAGAFTFRGDYVYRDKIYQDVFNDPRLTQQPYDVVNARASFMTSDERWELAIAVTNLTDERYRISGNSSLGFGVAESTFSAPREIAGTIRARF